MTRGARVVCVGVATIDTIAVVDRMPGEDERVVADGFTVAGGGPAATAAVTLARLGVPVAFCGVVGDDDAGRLVRASLEGEGVDTSLLRVDARARSTRSVILVSAATHARTIVTTPSTAPRPDDVPLDAEWLHVDQTGYRAVRAALERAPARHPRLSVDAGNAIEGLALDGVELYAPTASALARAFPGDLLEGLRAARAHGARRVLATAGADGSYVLQGESLVHVEPTEADVVSTLGAGDVFHGALLAAIVEGRDLVDAARFAGRVAALSCRALDGRSGIPHGEELAEPTAPGAGVAS